MGWWDSFYSITNAIDDCMWYIQSQLEDWVESWAEWAVNNVYWTYDIVRHTWADVQNEISNQMGSYYNNINDFYSTLKYKLTSDFSILQKSWYDITNYVDTKISTFQSSINTVSSNVSSLYNYAHTTLANQISSLATSVSTLYNYAHTTLNNRINEVAQEVNALGGTVTGITKTAKQMVGFIAGEAEKRWTILKISAAGLVSEINKSINALKKNYIDPQIKSLSQDIDSLADGLQGVTRTANQMVGFIAYEAEKKWGIIKMSWGDVTNLVSSKINTFNSSVIAPLALKVSSVTTRVDYLVNTTIKNINKSLDSLLLNINKLKVDYVLPMRTELTGLANSFKALPSWVHLNFAKLTNDLIEQFIKVFTASEKTSVRFLQALGIGAGEIITTILDTPADMVAWIKDAIADVFEEILDRVFR